MRPWFKLGLWSDECEYWEIPYICVTGLGIHFNNEAGGYNAHWYDLRHPFERYSRSDLRWVTFFKQCGRGLRLVLTNKMFR